MAWLRYAVCLDVEATFARGGRSDVPGGRFDANIGPEIVQVGVCVLDVETSAIVFEFSRVVKPYHNSTLSRSLVALTGLQQTDIDGADSFGNVWSELERALTKNGINGLNAVPATFSRADLGTFVPHQLVVLDRTLIDPFWSRVVDIQRVYGEFSGDSRPRSLKDALKGLEVKVEGRLHDALADARAVAAIWSALQQRGVHPERFVEHAVRETARVVGGVGRFIRSSRSNRSNRPRPRKARGNGTESTSSTSSTSSTTPLRLPHGLVKV